MKRKSSFTSVKGKKNVERLFQHGVSFFFYPFKVFYLKEESTFQHQLFISVPKRHINKAVHRNLVRRRIKEAFFYIYKKSILNNIHNNNKKYSIGLVYIAKNTMSLGDLLKILNKVLTRILIK